MTREMERLIERLALDCESVHVAEFGLPDDFGDRDAILTCYRDGHRSYVLDVTADGEVVRGRSVPSVPTR